MCLAHVLSERLRRLCCRESSVESCSSRDKGGDFASCWNAAARWRPAYVGLHRQVSCPGDVITFAELPSVSVHPRPVSHTQKKLRRSLSFTTNEGHLQPHAGHQLPPGLRYRCWHRLHGERLASIDWRAQRRLLPPRRDGIQDGSGPREGRGDLRAGGALVPRPRARDVVVRVGAERPER